MITDNLKILMLEDSDADAEMIQRLLKKNGCNCHFEVMMTKERYEQALNEFKPDLILSDNDMPQFNASEALAILQQHSLHIPFILVTGTVSEEFAASIIKAGADDYLLKDRLTRLPAAIETALKQKQTEREKLEAAEELKQSEEKYRSMTERVTDGFVALDKNWNYTYVNKQAGEILRRKPEELIGKNIWEEFPEGVEKPFYKGYHKAFEEQRYIHFEEYYPPFDFWLENHIYPSPDGVSIYFRDVTEKKKAESLLKEERDKFTKIADTAPGLIYSFKLTTDGQFSFPYASNSIGDIFGFKLEEIENNVSKVFSRGSAEEIAAVTQSIMQSAQTLLPWNYEFQYDHPVKGNRWLHGHSIPSKEPDGSIIWHGIISDVTQRRDAEQKIIKGNRLYSFISQMNQMIVRTTDEATLFEEVCRIAVEEGKFRMAWIGMIDEQTRTVVPVIYAGEEEGYLLNIKEVSLDDVPEGRGPTGRALREGKYIICNDIENDPAMALWSQEALSRGYRSSMSLPVKKFDKIVGSFSVYAPEKNFFDAEEITLLNEAVNDVSFALENFEREALRKKAEEAVAKSEHRYHTLTEVSPVGVFHTDAGGYTTYVNPRWCKITGLAFDEAMGNGWLKAVHKKDKEDLIKGWKNATEVQELSTSEYRFVHPDGTIAWVFGQATPERNAANEVVGYVGTITDITERKNAEQEIKNVNHRYETIARATNDAVFEIDLLTGYSKHNKAFVELFDFGHDTETALDNRVIWRSKLHPDDRDRVIKKLEETYTGTATVWTDEFRFKKADGSYGIFYDRASIVRDDSGSPIRFLGSMIEITELKNAEATIKRSNERFELIAKATNDALWDWNLETNKVWGNEVHQQLYGLTLSDPVPDREEWHKRIHSEDRQRTIEKFEEAKASGIQSYTDEYRFYTENNGWMNIYGRTLIERNKEGKAIRLIGSMMDITERKKAEELLAANEKRFRKLVENGNDAFAILNQDGSVKYISSSVQRVLGYSEEEIYKMEMFTLVHPDNIEEVQKTMQEVMENPGVPVTSHISRLKHKDGTWHWFEDTITNLLDDPDIRGIVDNFRDITERVNNQMALTQSEEKHRNIVENITDILCTHDLDGNVLTVNATAKRCLGYEIDEMLQMNIRDILLPYSQERFGAYITTLQKNGFAQGLMYVQTSTGENRVWEFRNTLRKIEGKPPFVYGFAQDVTERVKAEETVKNKNAQLQTLSDNLPGVMIYQLEGKRDGIKKFTYVSNGVIPITGRTPEEVIENPDILYDAIYKEDIARLITAENESLVDMSVLNIEVRCRTHKDEIRWLNIVSTPRKLESGQIIWDGFHLDITERKKEEDVLRESEETFSKIFYLNPSVCAINDLQDDKFVNVNEAFINYFGFSKEEVIGKTSVELGIMIPGIRNDILSKMDEHGIVHNIETSVKTRSGESKDVLLSTSNIYLHKKEYAYTVSNDITERKKAEETIKKANERFELFTKATNDVIWDWNLLTGELWWNENYYNLFGFEDADTVNKNINSWSKYIHPDDIKRIMDGIRNAIESGEKYWDDEYRFVKDDKSPMFIYDRGFVMRDEEGKAYRMIGSMLDFTERKKAEDEKKASDEQYRILVEQASDGIFIADEAGKFVIVNSSGCKLSGYTAEELKELTIYNLVQPASLVTNPFNFEEMHHPLGARSERKMLCKDGTELDVEISAKFLSDKRFIAFVRDISERIKAEEAVKASEEKYRSLVEQASDAIFIADTEGRFITVNSSACKLSQYSEEELMQMTIYDFVVEEDIKKQAFRFEELKQGKTTLTERVMKGKCGVQTHVEINSKLLSDGRLLSFVRDISERIKAQNEIIKEKNLSDSIINSLPASFFMINIYGKMLRWNRHLETASKYNAEEISTMHPFDFFDEADKGLLSEKVANVFLAGEDNMEATVCLKTNEKVPYYFKGIAIEYNGEPCIMGVGIDISERVKAQEEIKDTSEKLRQLTAHLQRVREDERKRIGREIHDELGQQLTAIKMDVAWIDKKTSDEVPVIKNKLKNIITLLDGSNQSIRRILSELRPGILDDNGLLEALEWLNRQFTAQTGIAVEFDTTETELKVPEPVATCIYRIYQEAFTNITRYAKAGKVHTSLNIVNGEITVTIEDDGNGFDAVAVQNKKSFGILGMKERILSLNGIFLLDSEPGKGTKVTIVLPLTT